MLFRSVKYSIDKSQRLDYMFYEKMGTYVLPGNLHKDFSRWMRGAVHYRWHKEKHVGVRRIAMTEEEARRKAKKAGGGVAKVQGAPKPARAKVPKAAEAPKPAAPKAKAALVPILRFATEGLLRRKPLATGHAPRAATPRQDLVLLSNTSEVTSSLEDRGLRFTHRTGVSRPGRLDMISLFVRIA